MDSYLSLMKKQEDWKLLKEVVNCIELLTKRQQECLLYLGWSVSLTPSTKYRGLWCCIVRRPPPVCAWEYHFFNSKTINPLFDMGLIGLGEFRPARSGELTVYHGAPEIQLTPAGYLLVSLLFHNDGY